MNDPLVITVGIFLFVGVAVLIFLFLEVRRMRSGQAMKQEDPTLKLMSDQMNDLRRTLDDKMGETNREVRDSMRSQFGESQKLVSQFMKELTQMTDKVARVEETGKQMVAFADQLQSLQEMLKNPKQRGILGEYYLEALLKNVMPPGSYKMQHVFSDGTIVDAAVYIKDKIIPIDSKFSLENYNKIVGERDPAERERLEKLFKADLKERIDETAKYVKPEENTLDFAFMFIPHEAIYYDLLVSQVGAVKVNTRDLIEYAFKEKHVIIVSPTSFLAYLQTVLQGLKALQIEESAKEIRKNVEELARHLKTYEDYHGKLGNALGTVVNQFNFSSKEFKKIDKDILRISGEALGLEVPLLEKPDIE